jgi:serine/threonine protein kinase
MDDDVQPLFHELADLPREVRERVLAERHIDPEIRQKLESLLKFDSDQSHLLTICIGDAVEQALNQERDRDPASCGPYRLVRPLGSGGMGTVYLAERTDGEIQQSVAVKLLRADGHRPEFRKRFLRERQFLASLNHPSIVHVIDAGHTDDGRPYLVMEYVDGVPIDVYCGSIPLRDQLTLFQRVCHGVAHAHQHLIIHRDLKPSNILVDAAGQPKLLDFGIARLLDEARDVTRTVERLLTPGYASPEQLNGTAQTTATDVFSLGAVLYKILTGRSPRESDGTLPAVSSLLEIRPPSRLNPSLPSDLDYILRKALRPEPAERYASVEGFANDIRAFLELKSVQARSGDAWYRTRKFMRRYWIPVAAAALVLTSLSLGLYVANRQRVIAERRFSQLHALSKKVIDLEVELGTSEPKFRNKLISMSIQYLEGLGSEALHDRTLDLEISNAYLRVARAQGVPEWNQLGQYADAEKSLDKANAFADSVLQGEPDNREALWLTANVAHDRAVTAYAERDPLRVISYSSATVDRFNRLTRLGHLTRREINGATYIYGDLAEVHLGLHRFADAARYARLGIEISKGNTTIPGPRAQAFNMLAGALMYSGDIHGALEAIQESRKQLDQLRRVDPYPGYIALILSQTRGREGRILGEDGGVNLNRPLEASAPLQEAYEALEPFAQRDATDYEARSVVAMAGLDWADVLRHTNPKRALEVYDHSLARIREVPNDISARRTEALLLASSSYPLRSIHREKDASGRIEAAFRLLKETKEYPATTITAGSEADTAMRALADHYAETGQPAQALDVYQELFRKIMASNPDPQNDLLNAAYVSRLHTSLASLLRRMGQVDEAIPLETARLELWKRWDGRLPNNSLVRRQLEAAHLP